MSAPRIGRVVDLELEEELFNEHRLPRPASPSVDANRAGLFWELGKYDAAIAMCDRIMRRWPDKLWYLPVCIGLRAQALACQGRREEAARYLQAMQDQYARDVRPFPSAPPGAKVKPRFELRYTLGSAVLLRVAVTRAWIAIREAPTTEAVAAVRSWQEAYRKLALRSDPATRARLQFGAMIALEHQAGDLHRLHGDYQAAARSYQAVMDHLREPSSWGRGAPAGLAAELTDRGSYRAWRNGELAALIRDCLARNVAPDSPLAWRRAVDYRIELGDQYRLYNNWHLAGQAYAEALRYLQNHPTRSAKYIELREKKLPPLAWIEWDWRVDQPIRCAKQYEEVGGWALAAQSYGDALDFLRSHARPQAMPEARRAQYGALQSKGLPEAIARCQRDLHAKGAKADASAPQTGPEGKPGDPCSCGCGGGNAAAAAKPAGQCGDTCCAPKPDASNAKGQKPKGAGPKE